MTVFFRAVQSGQKLSSIFYLEKVIPHVTARGAAVIITLQIL